jgi:phage gp29-like protein
LAVLGIEEALVDFEEVFAEVLVGIEEVLVGIVVELEEVLVDIEEVFAEEFAEFELEEVVLELLWVPLGVFHLREGLVVQ